MVCEKHKPKISVEACPTCLMVLVNENELCKESLKIENEVNTKLQANLARLREAMERLNSGEAFYVGGMIPVSMRPELRARSRFIDLVLEGKQVEDAGKQASQEQSQKTKDLLDQILGKEAENEEG